MQQDAVADRLGDLLGQVALGSQGAALEPLRQEVRDVLGGERQQQRRRVAAAAADRIGDQAPEAGQLARRPR